MQYRGQNEITKESLHPPSYDCVTTPTAFIEAPVSPLVIAPWSADQLALFAQWQSEGYQP